jgi:hypothetical protein
MSQQRRILNHLASGKTLNRLESWSELGVLECPARICELRDRGFDIKTRMKTVINRYGEKVRIAEWSM